MVPTNTRRLITAAVAAVTALALTACTGANDTPSKATIKESMTKIVKEQFGENGPTEMIEPVVNCLVEDSYDKLSDEAKKLFASGDAAKIQKDMPQKDVDVWLTASKSCQQKVVKDLGSK